MEKLEEIQEPLDLKLRKQLVPARAILDKFRVIEESSRKSAAYSDPLYVPFYYYLGCLVKPKLLAEFGFRLGLMSGAFLLGCKTVERFFTFQEKSEDYYSPRLARKNIKSSGYRGEFDFYLGTIYDDELESKFSGRGWEVVIINDNRSYDYHRAILDLAWKGLSNDGLIVSDNLSNPGIKKAFSDFCQAKSRENILANTRYIVGMVQK